MTVSDFSSALDAAFEAPDPRDAVNRIKVLVAGELEEADSRVTVKKTEFFNHGFAPDLVLTWPNADERFVYLKSDTHPDVLRYDVKSIRKHSPIVFALDQLYPEYVSVDSAETQEDDTLVADSRGIEVLIDRRRSDPVVGLASSAVLQGGRGLLTESEAKTMAVSVSGGFTGAQRLDANKTGVAVAQITDHFDARRASRLLRLLSAVWVGSGGTPASFPGQQGSFGDLDSAALEFLLELPPIDNYEFWRRIGRSLRLEVVSGLEIEENSQNLQHLVESNLDVLHARACRVVNVQQELGEADEGNFHWSVDRQMLCLRGRRTAAYFASKVDGLIVDPEEQDGISLERLLDRAEARMIPISELELATPTRTVSYATVNRDDVSHDEELMELSRTFSSTAYVQSAVATLMGSRPLVCDLKSRTAKGRTTTRFPIGELVPAAMFLLTDISPEEEQELLYITRHYESHRETQLSLFDATD